MLTFLRFIIILLIFPRPVRLSNTLLIALRALEIGLKLESLNSLYINIVSFKVLISQFLFFYF